MLRIVVTSTACLSLALTAPQVAEETPLADFYGFDGLEIVKIDEGAGPMTVKDLNGDGLLDLVVVNNRASRIEIHYQRPGARPGDDLVTVNRVNDLPQHWRFRREFVSVSHRVAAVLCHDYDGDNLVDLIFAGTPAEIVFVRQSALGVFEIDRRHRIKGIAATRNAFAISDLIGDRRPEIAAIVGGEIRLWTLDGSNLGKPLRLSAGGEMVAFMIEDFDGNGLDDVCGILVDDPAPLRIWTARRDGRNRVFGPQIRFEMPALLEFQAVRRRPDKPASLAVIERAAKRMVMYDLVKEPVETEGNRDAALAVYGFSDPDNRKRSTAVVDVDGDDLLDLVATDTLANALVLYRQIPGQGLHQGDSFPCYAELDAVVAGDIDDDPYAEIFVLSEKEAVVGRCDVTADRIPYPIPLSIPDGHTPVALNLVHLEDGPAVAVVVKKSRKYSIVLINDDGTSEPIELTSQSRSPETILDLDADQDGRTDLLLFTPDKPMMMLRADETGFKLLESKAMGQFGLVKAATAENTTVFDIDGDGKSELLIADRNFVRAVRYEPDRVGTASPGWQVVTQINADEPTSKLVSLAAWGRRVVAADKNNDRLVFIGPDGGTAGAQWRELESVNTTGFAFDSIHLGNFVGGDEPSILAVGHAGFAIIRLEGERLALRDVATWRSDEERQLHHELSTGDLNGDGYLDVVSLDAGEQMCEIFTFTEKGVLRNATGFKVFESKIFSGGASREFQPSEAIIADITGDDANDLLLLAHDRVLIYPQTTRETSQAKR